MRRQPITPCQIAIVWDWMTELEYTDGGAIRRIPSAWIMLYARVWTLTQGASYYGIRAVDLGAWAGLRDKESIQDNLNQMVAAGLLRKAPAGVQGCGYCAVVPHVRDASWHVDVEGWMVTSLGLRSAAEIITYALVYSFRRGGCWMTPKRIAACVGCTERYVSKVLARLQSASELHNGCPLIVIGSDGHRRPNAAIYRQYVRAAEDAIREAAGDIWDQEKQRRRDGHRSVERQYRQAMNAIVRDIIQGGDGSWTE